MIFQEIFKNLLINYRQDLKPQNVQEWEDL
jgi:hypothetical protein